MKEIKFKYNYNPDKVYILTLKPQLKGSDLPAFLELIRENKPIILPKETIHWVEEKRG